MGEGVAFSADDVSVCNVEVRERPVECGAMRSLATRCLYCCLASGRALTFLTDHHACSVCEPYVACVCYGSAVPEDDHKVRGNYFDLDSECRDSFAR